MKYGEFLQSQIVPEWKDYYLDYEKLKNIIKILEEQFVTVHAPTKATSLSVPRPTNAAGVPVSSNQNITQEEFFTILEEEMKKIEEFTHNKVTQIHRLLLEIEKKISSNTIDPNKIEELKQLVEKNGEEFLKLEKYVNLNFTAFHKILKKHDRRLPNPCQSLYMTRLHEQKWVKGEYSDVMMRFSRVYQRLRGENDEEFVKNDKKLNQHQNINYTTKRYWVHMEDVSAVKYAVVQHLPVQLQSTNMGESDSVLINSLYLDNHTLELYHSRLEKQSGSVTLRLRWNGTGIPKEVSIEREIQRERESSDISYSNKTGSNDLSDRFYSIRQKILVKEDKISSLLNGTINIEKDAEQLRKEEISEAIKIATGNSTVKIENPSINIEEIDEKVREWKHLLGEITQTITSKQLVPTIRTQFMRTQFMIPKVLNENNNNSFTATNPHISITLDTQLCMINERNYTEAPSNGSISANSKHKWLRDPTKPIPNNEIIRFPHAILEIKTMFVTSSNVNESIKYPDWLNTLLKSGKLLEVHKFSGYLHGCSVLLREDVRKVPYWIDEMSNSADYDERKNSIDSNLIEKKTVLTNSEQIKQYLKDIQSYHDIDLSNQNIQSSSSSSPFSFTSCCENNFCCLFSGDDELCDCSFLLAESEEFVNEGGNAGGALRESPKVLFANERTFLHWIHMAVMLSSISSGVLAFLPSTSKSSFIETFAFFFLFLSLVFIMYALYNFYMRTNKIKNNYTEQWDDTLGPILITILLILFLCFQFILQIAKFIEEKN